jgi:hypothetical protein
MTSFFLAQASPALLDPGLLAIITATMTFVGLTCLTQIWWPPPPGRVRERERRREHTARRARALVRGWAG